MPADFEEILGPTPPLSDALSRYRRYATKNAMPERALILCGFPKSGNTWLRFVYQHLIAVSLDSSFNETLTYTRLNSTQPNSDFPYALTRGEFTEPVNFNHTGFRMMFHSHGTAAPEWTEFGDIALVYRNPLDTLLSTWHATVQFVAETRDSVPVDTFVLQRLPEWCAMFCGNSAVAVTSIAYEAARAAPYQVIPAAFREWGIEFDEKNLEKAIALSDFSAVRRMEDATGQHHGHRTPNPELDRPQPTPWADEPGVRFTRSGESGQWRTALSPETVAQAAAILGENGIDPRQWEIG